MTDDRENGAGGSTFLRPGVTVTFPRPIRKRTLWDRCPWILTSPRHGPCSCGVRDLHVGPHVCPHGFDVGVWERPWPRRFAYPLAKTVPQKEPTT